MKILSHGLPFFCAYDTVAQYRGAHEIRTLSAQPLADYRLRPEVDTLHDILARIAPEFVPDLILVWTPENDPPPLGIEHSPVPTACLAGDWNLFHNAQEINFGRYDVVLADRVGAKLLKNDFVNPTYWGPLYAQNTMLHRETPGERDIDVLYIGNLNLSHRGERGKWLQRLAMLPKHHEILLTTDVWREDYAGLLSRAKIVFNHSVRGELNLRVFESMACGALAFFEEYNQEVKDYFTDGVDIVLYNDSNFEEKLTYYLEQPEEREAIARRGQARAQAFAGEARFDALIDYILAQPRSGRPFLQLDEKERALQDFLMITVSQRPEYGPLEQCLGRDLVEQYPDEPRARSAFARSNFFYRHTAPNGGQIFECLDAHKRALSAEPDSAIHAINGALVAQAICNAKAEEIFLTIALKATSIEPSGYLWGNWQDPFWTHWLRVRPEGGISLALVHAEAHARLARLKRARADLDGALADLDAALALAPGNSRYAEQRADLLWALGREDDALRATIEDLPQHPLDTQYRFALAEKCIAKGYSARALQCVSENEAIIARLRVPYRAPRPPAGHLAAREPATTTPMAEQERRLRARAVETGRHAPLLWFLSALGRGGEAAALPLTTAEDSATSAVLFGEATLATLEGLNDPALHHALLKRALRANDVETAWAIADAAQAVAPQDVRCINLLARWLSQRGDARTAEAVARSLAVAPRQEDIAPLAAQPFDGTIHLDPAPHYAPISFYLPAYNVAQYIRDTIEHVLLQDYPIAEFFVVDDGATDDSIPIAREYPITILRHDQNRGLAAARNTALVAATGEWLLSTDTDARPEGDYVRQVMLELETRDARVAAIGGVLNEAFQEDPPDRWRALVMAQHHGPARQAPPWFLYGSTMCIERAAALAAGGYDEAHRTNGEDTELCKALACAGRTLLYTPAPRALHMRRDTLQSALRTWWNWHYWVKVESHAWNIVGGLVDAMLHNLAQASAQLQKWCDTGETRLIYLALLFPFHDALHDIAHAHAKGLLMPGERLTLQTMLLERARALDARYGGTFAAKVHRDCAEFLLEGEAPASLPANMAHEFARYFTPLDTLLDSIPLEIYQLALA